MKLTFKNFAEALVWLWENIAEIEDERVVIQEIKVEYLRMKILPYKKSCASYKCHKFFIPTNGLQRYCPDCVVRLKKLRTVIVND